MLKRKFCPKGVVSMQSMYLIEQIQLLDTDMGVTLPYTFNDIPVLFIQALRIIREIKAEGRKDG